MTAFALAARTAISRPGGGRSTNRRRTRIRSPAAATPTSRARMATLMDWQHASDFVALLPPPRRADHITPSLPVALAMAGGAPIPACRGRQMDRAGAGAGDPAEAITLTAGPST